jgi:hypothetical protein
VPLTPETKELLDRFEQPAAEYGPVPFWWWSGAQVTRERLRWQMEQMLSQGIGQAVIICLAPRGPLYGRLGDDPQFFSPAWFELLEGACEDAQQLGFKLWLYDQIGFSSANIQGRLIAANPEYAGLALRRTETGEIEEHRSGFDYLSREACASLIEQVHGEFERHVGRWFGTVITGFFADEWPPVPTWSRNFSETFSEQYGYDLRAVRGALFEGGDPESARIRRDYHEHRGRLARRALFDPLADWLEARGLLGGFDQLTSTREGDPIGGVMIYGDYLGTHARFSAPGCDHWGDPKVHSSLAHAHRHPRTWIEAFHSSGWGATLEETYDWLAPFLRRGATLYNAHAIYYSTVGGWWEWAPPSSCWRQPYWPAYNQFAATVSRLCSVLTTGQHVCDVVLLSPTTTAQAYTTLEGALPPAERASICYHALNGISTWFREQQGALERAGIDHDVLDEATLAAGEVISGSLKIADEVYRTVILPDVQLLGQAAAAKLTEFGHAGGSVICVEAVPEELKDVALAVATAEEVPALVATGPVQVEADAPILLRRHGDVYVLLLVAHDKRSGTKAPMLELGDDDIAVWRAQEYVTRVFAASSQLRERGYEFVPAGNRMAHVSVHGVEQVRAQRWDARTGRRTEIAVSADRESARFDVSFENGPIALVVLGEHLPDPDSEPLGEALEVLSLQGAWRALAESTLDNRQGDLAAPKRDGVLPIEVWRLEHWTGEDWLPVCASFGPFAEVRDPDGTWRLTEWSLSRGIANDPLHDTQLGASGYVPEEFLLWRHVPKSRSVAVRTYLDVPKQGGLHLAVGSAAARRVSIDGCEMPVEGDGYQSFSPLPPEKSGQRVQLEIELASEQDGPVRASFAVVADPAAYRRPEWVAGDPLSRTFQLDEIPLDGRIQVASLGACTVELNGVEMGRQGHTHAYRDQPEWISADVQTYDLAGSLRIGDNTLTLHFVEGGVAAVDAPELDLSTSGGWRATVTRRGQLDRRVLCCRPRPHPLPRAAWLEKAETQSATVLPIIPDVAPSGERTELLRFAAPLGTVALRIPTDLDVLVVIGETEYTPVDGRVRLPHPLSAGTPVLLHVGAVDGRRGGALLDRGIEVEAAEVETELASWEDLGLRALGGQVRYRSSFGGLDGHVVVDLGEVRGTADVLVNGKLVDQLVWGPWRTEITEALRPGENELEVVVRGTLAGYLDDASPTQFVFAGQVRTGLFGPVQLIQHRVQALVTGIEQDRMG